MTYNINYSRGGQDEIQGGNNGVKNNDLFHNGNLSSMRREALDNAEFEDFNST